MNLNGHAALSGDYNDRTRLKTVKIECFVKRIQGQRFFILPVPPTPSLATGYTDNQLSTPVSHIKPDEQNLFLSKLPYHSPLMPIFTAREASSSTQSTASFHAPVSAGGFSHFTCS